MANYQLVLFDADDTLFDFHQAQEYAFSWVMQELAGQPCEENHLHSFRNLNLELWTQFEQGRIGKEEVKVRRFEEFALQHGIAWNSEQVSEQYLEQICENVLLVPGAERLCRELKPHVRIGIVTNGVAYVQHRRVHSSELAPYIDFMVVSEECGYPKPMPQIFESALNLAPGIAKSKTLMIGDRLDTDILGADRFGIDSCWFNPEKKALSGPQMPTYEVQQLHEILNIVLE